MPSLSLRIISDAADESLPDLLKDGQREGGSTDRTRVMQSAVWSPGAAETLAERVPTVLRHREGQGP